MNLINIIYEPYFIIISISLIITLISFFIIRNNKSEEEQQNNTPQILLYTFFISFILLIILNYGLEYMNKNNFFQKGGVNKVDLVNNLTIVADDIECGLIDE